MNHHIQIIQHPAAIQTSLACQVLDTLANHRNHCRQLPLSLRPWDPTGDRLRCGAIWRQGPIATSGIPGKRIQDSLEMTVSLQISASCKCKLGRISMNQWGESGDLASSARYTVLQSYSLTVLQSYSHLNRNHGLIQLHCIFLIARQCR